MDRSLIARGVSRCSAKRFYASLLPWTALLGFGVSPIIGYFIALSAVRHHARARARHAEGGR